MLILIFIVFFACHCFFSLFTFPLTSILPACRHVSTTVWLYHFDFNKTPWEKARWTLHKDAMCCFEQILEATPNKTVTVEPLASQLKNHPSKTNKTCWALLEKQGQTHKQHSSTNRPTIIARSAKTDIQQLCLDSGCHQEDLPTANGW